MIRYAFEIPQLPKEWYQWIKIRRENFHATSWEVIMTVLYMAGQRPTMEFQAALNEVKRKYKEDTRRETHANTS